jgi:hypothetical protein
MLAMQEQLPVNVSPDGDFAASSSDRANARAHARARAGGRLRFQGWLLEGVVSARDQLRSVRRRFGWSSTLASAATALS